ncbi:MAG: DUF4835 family protein [Ignavibacteriaceae bacterium]|nr:DUF4835 family protein [Ignavibacteriaceae bacterium]
MKKLIVLFVILLAALSVAQELNCRVSVNYEGLPVSNRENLVPFASMIEEYMNKTRFTSEAWDGGKIDCSLNILFTGASTEVEYNAQIVVISQRPIFQSANNSLMLSLNDNAWSFQYEKGQGLYQNQSVYDPITSMLDFYAYLIIGYDLDSWQELGGTDFYTKAYNIVNLGSTSRYKTGWERNSNSYSRLGLVEDLLNEKYRILREAMADYYYGLDYFTEKPEITYERIEKLVTTLETMKKKGNINSVFLKVFLDAKHGEIINYLTNYTGKDNLLERLSKIDPAHSAKYNAALG